MSANEKQALINQLNLIAKAIKLAKSVLTEGTATELFKQLKAAHNATTKAKNELIEVAMLTLDNVEV